MATREYPPPLPQRLSRRRLLLQALGLTAAGLTVGGGAAWAGGQLQNNISNRADLTKLQSQLAAADTAYAELAAAHTALQQQLSGLQGQLTAATAQNSQLAGALAARQEENARLQSQVADLQERLKAATARNTLLQELTNLYEMLEATDLDTIVQDGLRLVATGLGSVAGVAALASSGLILARSLLVRFEQALPDMQTAMRWLSGRFREFGDNLTLIENSAQKLAGRAASGIAAVFGGFVSVVISYLPFNIGEQARETLAIIKSLLAALADTLSRAETDALPKISQRIADGPEGWKQTLLKPLREQTLLPAERLISALTEIQATFTATLNDPTGTALAQRAEMREKIAAFRAQYEL